MQQQLLDRNQAIHFLFFSFSSPSSPHVSCTAAAAAIRTMEKGKSALPFFSRQLTYQIAVIAAAWVEQLINAILNTVSERKWMT